MSKMWIGLVPGSPRTHVAVKSALGGANLNLAIRSEAGLGRVVDMKGADITRVLNKINSVYVPRYGPLARYAYVISADGMDRSSVPATVAECVAREDEARKQVFKVLVVDDEPKPGKSAKDDETKKTEKPKGGRGRGRGRKPK